LNPRYEKEIFIGYIKEFNQYLVLLSDKQQIVKATNSKFVENENSSNSCKSGKNMQLEKVLKSEHVNFKKFNNKNSSSDDENDDNEIVNENAGENEIFTLSSNSLNSSKSPTANLNSMNSNKIIKTDKIININDDITVQKHKKQSQKSSIDSTQIIKDKQESKFSTQVKEYIKSKNFFKS